MDHPTHSWVTSLVMAKILGIHRQTLLRLRRSEYSPFTEGRDFRWSGMTTNSNLQWHVATTESTFTNARRMPAAELETFGAVAR